MTLLRHARCFSPSFWHRQSTRVAIRRRTVILHNHGEPPSQRPFPPEAVQSLLRSALSRSKRTLSEKNGYYSTTSTTQEEPQEAVDLTGLLSSIAVAMDSSSTTNSSTPQQQQQQQQQQRTDITNNLLTSIASRSKRTLSTTRNVASKEVTTTTTKEEEAPGKESLPASTHNKPDFTTTDLRYNQNPAISLTALAHWLWSSVLRPHQDSAIDATCGNGNDSVGMASILFGNEDLYLYKTAELICIDIQETACSRTRDALAKVVSPWILSNQIQILEASHAKLPVPTQHKQPGLVVYNLGYLPNNQNDEESKVTTQIGSTLASITDALLMVRVGGMVSIMIYPGTNRAEDEAVRTLLEATVALTNKKGPSWEETLAQQMKEDKEGLHSLLTEQLERMALAYQSQGGVTRTFRITEHKKIGLASAPILMTATRIK